MSFNNNIILYEKAPNYVRIVKFICDICGRRWNSASGNLEDYQICKSCYRKCYPVNYKLEAPNKRGNQNRETYQPHKSELCGKCIRLGHSCMEIGQGNGLIVFNSEGQELTLRERNLSNFMYTNNSIFNTTITNKNESSVDIANQEDAFPPLTDNHIEYRNEKEKPSSSSSEVWSDNYYQSLNVHSNSTSNDDRYYSEDDQSEGIDHTEDGQRDYEISYVEELQYDDIDRCADDDQVSYIIYSESDDEYIDHYLSVEGLLGLDIYEDNEGNNNEDDNNEDDDKEVYYQALLNDADSYKYLLTEDLPDEDLPDEDLPDEDLPDEDLSNEDWTEEEWDHHVRLRKQKHYIS